MTSASQLYPDHPKMYPNDFKIHWQSSRDRLTSIVSWWTLLVYAIWGRKNCPKVNTELERRILQSVSTDTEESDWLPGNDVTERLASSRVTALTKKWEMKETSRHLILNEQRNIDDESAYVANIDNNWRLAVDMAYWCSCLLCHIN